MSGHSKWSTIRHKKGAADAKRGKIFTKLIKEIMVAARMGGADPGANPRLRAAVLAAKAENMPKENIERAIKKGSGEMEGVNYEEINYEGYGPAGVAILLEILTDNRNRAASEVRHIFSRNGGNMGEAGCVAWMFDKKGTIVFNKENVSEEELMEVALEAGAEDVRDAESQFEVVTSLEDFNAVKEAFDEKGMTYELAEITMVPQTTVPISDEKTAMQILKLMDALEDNDDVQHAYANFDIPDEILNAIA
ncbi:YebC/PmpR family DNA-binding transcriptional regulator [Desulforhabdus amnigena]|jgi:YebC/PmpR family DNA-binding regulatory protein|uniref:Probable transcriptional regulatory protein DAMNIGENAA_17630 n=1 Tax=Desulforhabdus amnigena TaxID=40218 RepID=A0A9W6D554_9BACT|nr:YebC/PmpR family DNA-binding transcriptional regulator [Desulforhabdus amnigena]NLJ29400.1 YebC/PmpR family DNA-binding transcriptional regulator [Deltaproteobacteria bacterium]GLI34330.1 putative transcriptional regulatory protein [Desulforhabdus amnigena]